MNRTIEDATVKRYHYDSHDQLRDHLRLFVDAHDHARRLKTLRGLTPYDRICQARTKEPERFTGDPSHHIPGPYIEAMTCPAPYDVRWSLILMAARIGIIAGRWLPKE